MRKGDEKRQDILTVAEKLFCTKGYEATSVQDILDVLHVSKGGFYHHFSSKEALLQTMCGMHADKSAQQALQRLTEENHPMRRINMLLHCFVPLRREEATFMNMLFPLLEKPEGRALCLYYQEALLEVFLPLMEKELEAAYRLGVIHPPTDEVGDLLLTVVNRCWLDAMMKLLDSVKKGQRYDGVMLLMLLSRYRRCVEVLLDAPFGSIEILRLEEWDEIAMRLTRTMNLPRV